MIYGSVSTGSHCEKIVFEDELGWECAFVSEIDRYVSQVIRYHAPDTPNLGDFSKIEANESTTRIDLLCGGTPCQAFSVAGLRKGFADDRGSLTLEFLRLADRLKPTWILWENVPGVLSIDGGRAFGAFLGGLAELGYGFAFRVLDAQFFGVPQRRRRVFVVGHLGDWRRAAAVLFERESLSGHPAPSREAGAGVAGTLEARASTGGYDPGAHGAASGHLIPMQEISKRTGVSTNDPRAGIGIGGDGDPMYTLQSGAQHGVAYQCHGSNVGPMGAIRAGNGNESGGAPFVAQEAYSVNFCDSNGSRPDRPNGGLYVTKIDDKTSPALTAADSPVKIVGFNGRQDPSDHSAGSLDEDGSSQCIAFTTEQTPKFSSDQAFTLTKQSPTGGGQPQAVAFQEAQTGVREYPEAGTLRANGPGHDPVGTRIRTGMSVRRLMPVECERLQGWPDGWTEYGRTKAGDIVEISDTQRYKIIGNGWCLNVIRWIAHRIDWVDSQP